jgi:ectoine hydroxylase-related dioxygenase (phytanoyl-CoA dioxygenase family)
VIADSGYEVVDGVFAPSELEVAIAALEAHSVTRSRAGARHVLALPAVRALAIDSRMLALAARFVATAQPFRATLFDKSPSANWLVAWHQDTALPMRARADTPGWGPWSTKAGALYAHAPAAALVQVVALRLALDDSTSANGPLRVLPGTHRHGRLDDPAIARLAQAIAPVACTVDAGGVVALRPLLLHASSKSTSEARRRVLHIEYASATSFGPGLDLRVA